MAFAQYVSLGGNCEVAFQFRRALGRDESSFFSWDFVSVPQVVALLENRFAGILEAQNIASWVDADRMAWDKAYGYRFHSPFATAEPHDDPEFDSRLAEHRQKAAYLIQKLYADAGPRAYFIVLREAWTPQDLTRLNELLSDIGHDYQLVVLSDTDATLDLGPNVAFRRLTHLAPVEDAPAGHEPSWDAVFAEFPHVEMLSSRAIRA